MVPLLENLSRMCRVTPLKLRKILCLAIKNSSIQWSKLCIFSRERDALHLSSQKYSPLSLLPHNVRKENIPQEKNWTCKWSTMFILIPLVLIITVYTHYHLLSYQMMTLLQSKPYSILYYFWFFLWFYICQSLVDSMNLHWMIHIQEEKWLVQCKVDLKSYAPETRIISMSTIYVKPWITHTDPLPRYNICQLYCSGSLISTIWPLYLSHIFFTIHTITTTKYF